MTTSTVNTVVTASLLAALVTTAADADTSFDDYGPLKTYAQSPLQSNSLTPLLRSGFSNRPGAVELYATGTMASIWAETEDYTADYYQNALTVGGQWQVDERWTIDLDYTWHFAANNHLDNLTTIFHDTFGLSQNGRENVDDHSFDISDPEHGIEIHDFRGETLSNAITLYSGYQLIETDRHGLSVGGALYYNYVSSGPFKNNSFEQSLQANYGYRTGRHRIYTTLGVSHRRGDKALADLPYKKYAFMASVGYQFVLTERHRILLEYHLYEGASETSSDLSQPSNEVLLGYRYHLNNGAVEVSMIENVFNMDNSADIAFTLGYRHRF
ncbi:DUF3187 family protein [Photobacterium sp.]|uniref:DUF3187 family protein n=1 Tax=Photobacterium sp. TaxID=660 RepID=UPI00299E1444|nr:DUF3187 family protein [Photobacterium sp.]MDX1303079.1 DUF3187 family protein [Photobacterium sp.]